MGDSTHTHLAGYEVKEMLGSGGMADVYAGVQLSLGREVAIKIRRSRRDEHESKLRERFVKTARLHANLWHRNIVGVIDFVSRDGVDALILERLSGPSLQTRLRRDGPIPVPELLHLTLDIIGALRYLHDRDVVHRDIKPSNIMYISEDYTSPVRLMDFGVARDVFAQDGLTLQGSQVGTLWYMSPEQLSGRPPASSCDLFALAVTLYELATGCLPINGQEESAVFRRVLDQESMPAFPAAIAEQYPEFCVLIEASLEIDKAKRLLDVEVFEACVRVLADKYNRIDVSRGSVGRLAHDRLSTALDAVAIEQRAALTSLLSAYANPNMTLTMTMSQVDESSIVASLDQTIVTEIISEDEGDGD